MHDYSPISHQWETTSMTNFYCTIAEAKHLSLQHYFHNYKIETLLARLTLQKFCCNYTEEFKK